MLTDSSTNPEWRKSSFSSSNSDCVEIAPTDDGVMIRNSNDLDQGVMTFTRAELSAFIAGAKAGEFDDLT